MLDLSAMLELPDAALRRKRNGICSIVVISITYSRIFFTLIIRGAAMLLLVEFSGINSWKK